MEVRGSVGRWEQACTRIRCGAIWGAMALAVLAAAACQRDGEARDVSETPPTDSSTALSSEEREVSVNRIAAVSATGELFTIGPDGDNLRRLTGGIQTGVGSSGPVLAQPLDLNNYYAWPTWSPDGTKIAASRVSVSDVETRVTLEVIDVETARTQTVYKNPVPAQIARGAPHYLYWSPDSRYLAFLANDSQKQTLFVLDTLAEGEPKALATGAPLYYHWAADSSALLIHVRQEVNLARRPFDEAPVPLTTARGFFRAPAFSPDGERFAYTDVTETAASLLVAPVNNPEQGRNILEVGMLAAFTWSPDGQEIAIADQLDPSRGVFERLRVVSADGGQVKTIGDGPILAFHWSPQGDRISWVVLDIEARSFDWKVSANSGGPANQLIRFQPSSNVFTMLSFFDQYAYSHSPWSPDGTRLVVAGIAEETLGGGNGATPTGDRVFILDATGAEAPRNIAPGVLAFWSWN